jgi:hypothetical protein
LTPPPLPRAPAAGRVEHAQLSTLPARARLVHVSTVKILAQIQAGLLEVASREVEGCGALLTCTPNQLDGLELWAIGTSLDDF